jgi:hypothetical protein
VLATADTDLEGNDVFYFGNAIGEAGDSELNASVNAADMLAARNNPRTVTNPALVDFPYDYNRDARVNALDMLVARNHRSHFLNGLKLIDAPAAKDAAAAKALGQPVDQAATSQEKAAACDANLEQLGNKADDLAASAGQWASVLHEFEQASSQDRQLKKESAADQAVDQLLATWPNQ